jgi:hypothetical protein
MGKEVKTFIIDVNSVPTEFCAFLGYQGVQESVVVCIIENGIQKDVIRLALKTDTWISLSMLSSDKKVDEGLLVCKERGYFDNILEIMESGVVIDDVF